MNNIMKSMRICILPPADLSIESGSTLYAKNIIKGLISQGHNVSVLCSKPDYTLKANYIEAPIPLPHPYDDNQGTSSRIFYNCINLMYRHIEPYLENNSWDVIHAIYPSFTGIVAALASTFYNISSVISCMGRIVNLGAILDKRYEYMAMISFSGSNFIIVSNDEIKEKIIKQYNVPEEKIKVLLIPINLSNFNNINQLEDKERIMGNNKFNILSVCSCLTEEKGVTDVLNALSILKYDCDFIFKYNIIGPDPVENAPCMKSLYNLAVKLGISDSVNFIGYIPNNEIANYVKKADIFIDARKVGNFSSVILEALSVGSAIICSDTRGNTEFINNKQNGIIFKVGDIHSLVNAIKELITYPYKIQKYKDESKRWFELYGYKYQCTTHISLLEEIYYSCISKKNDNFNKDS